MVWIIAWTEDCRRNAILQNLILLVGPLSVPAKHPFDPAHVFPYPTQATQFRELTPIPKPNLSSLVFTCGTLAPGNGLNSSFGSLVF